MTPRNHSTADEPFEVDSPLLDLFRAATEPAACPAYPPFTAGGDPGEAIRAAVAEAVALPAYERPTSIGETARWVKTRLHGHAPLPVPEATEFLVAFATVELHRPRGEVVNDWPRVPAGSPRSTVHATAGVSTDGGRARQPQAVIALLETDQTAGTLLLLSEFAGQSPDALAALTGRPVDVVRSELAAALAWVRAEMEPAG